MRVSTAEAETRSRTSSLELHRGRVYLADLTDEGGEAKPWVIVSNNARNRGLSSALAVRVTTTNKFNDLDSVVELPGGECVHGWVRCDSLTTMWEDEPTKEVGGLSAPAMRAIEGGLRAALGM